MPCLLPAAAQAASFTSGNFTTGAATTPHSVAAGDFNRDGSVDLVTTAETANGFVVMTGDGGGGFTAGTLLGAGTAPRGVAVGELNGDGFQDIVSADNGSSSVTVRFGDMANTFTVTSPFPTGAGTTPEAVALGDWDGDGDTDIATANTSTHDVTVLLNNGAGVFSAALGSPFVTFNGPRDLDSGDFDQDGDLDLAVAADDAADAIGIMDGSGTGTFANATAVPLGTNSDPRQVVVADLNRDGDLDAAATQNGHGQVGIAFDDGTGSFATAPQEVTLAGPANAATALVAADVDDDGDTDLAATQAGAEVSVLANDGAGAFTEDGAPRAVNGEASGIAAGDFDRDGVQDLVTADGAADTITVLTNTTATQPGNYVGGPTSFGPDGNAVASADIDRDGFPDLVKARSSGDIIIRNGGNPPVYNTNAAVLSLAGAPNLAAVALADFNGDGRLDIAAAEPANNQVSILMNSGGFTYLPEQTVVIGNEPRSLATGDFDRDGDVDFVATTKATDDIQVALNDGTGTAWPPPTGVAACDAPTDVVAGDFNRNGPLDLAVTCEGSDTVVGFNGNGAGGFANTLTGGLGGATDPVAIAAGDLNRDGSLDLAVANRGTDNVTTLYNTGSGGIASSALTSTGTDPTDVVVGDFTGDGFPDVATSDDGSDTISILHNNGAGTFVIAPRFAVDSAPRGLTTDDFNRDGDPDLATTGAFVLAARDVTAPVTSDDVPASTQPANHAVTLSVSDAQSGAHKTYYEVGGTPPSPNPATSPTYDPAAKPVLSNGQQIKYLTVDRAGNVESAKTSATLTVASSPPPSPPPPSPPPPSPPPDAPTGLATTPASGSNANNPSVRGSAPAGTVVSLYGTADCSGPSVAMGLAEQFATGFSVSVPDNSTTSFSATASQGGLTSGCSAPVSYTEDSPAPEQPPPEQKRTANVEAKSGEVVIKCPGQGEAELEGEAQVKLGCRIDATKGVVALTTENEKGELQTAEFFDGAFVARQVSGTEVVKKKKVKVLVTELRLDVAKPSGCTKRKSRIVPAARRGGRLWGRGRGRFRTRGRRGAATVRGTTWLTEERCEGTFFRVTDGSITVDDFTLKKTVTLKKGKSYLAPASKPARKKR